MDTSCYDANFSSDTRGSDGSGWDRTDSVGQYYRPQIMYMRHILISEDLVLFTPKGPKSRFQTRRLQLPNTIPEKSIKSINFEGIRA
jgi:hypothetical protein